MDQRIIPLIMCGGAGTRLRPASRIEVQTGSYLGEDDIIRIEDDYQRS
jgi:hypothetical protein